MARQWHPARRKFTPELSSKPCAPNTCRRFLRLNQGWANRILMAPSTRSFTFYCTQSVKDLRAREGTNTRYGAPHLKRAIERNLVFPLASLLATGQVKLGTSLESTSVPRVCDLRERRRECGGFRTTNNLRWDSRCAVYDAQLAPSPVSSVLLH
jgi:hypothetical protein